MVQNFNIESEKPPFIYRRNPLTEKDFQIFQWKDDKRDYEPVGDYTVIDTDQDPEFIEKMVMNIVSSMNGRTERLLDLRNLTSERILYNIVDNKDTNESDYITIMLRSHDNEGVSKENAVLKIEKGVIDGFSDTT